MVLKNDRRKNIDGCNKRLKELEVYTEIKHNPLKQNTSQSIISTMIRQQNDKQQIAFFPSENENTISNGGK